jgi:hypothetical protein
VSDLDSSINFFGFPECAGFFVPSQGLDFLGAECVHSNGAMDTARATCQQSARMCGGRLSRAPGRRRQGHRNGEGRGRLAGGWREVGGR